MAYFLTESKHKIYFHQDLEIVLKSPVFYEENNYSFPIQLPINDVTRAAFGYPDEINCTNNKTRQIAAVLYADSFSDSGIITLYSDDNGMYEMNFTGSGSIQNKLAGIYLNNLQIPDFNIGDLRQTVAFNAVEDFYYIDAGNPVLCFAPFYNYEVQKQFAYLWGSLNQSLNVPIVNYPLAVGSYIVVEDYSRQYWDPYLTPSYFIRYIVVKLFNQLGFRVNANFFDNEEVNKLLFLTNNALPHFSFKEPDENLKAGGLVYGLTITDKSIRVGAYITGTISDGDFIQLYNCNFPQSGNYNNRIFQITEIDTTGFTISNYECTDLNSISDFYLCDWKRMRLEFYDFPNILDSSTYLPAIKAKEFIDNLKSFFNLAIDSSSKSVDIVSIEEIYASHEFTDISNYSGVLKNKKLNDSGGFVFDFKKPDSDAYYSELNKTIDETYTRIADRNTPLELPVVANENDYCYVRSEKAYFSYKTWNLSARIQPNGTTTDTGNWSFHSFVVPIKIGEGKTKIEIKATPVCQYMGGFLTGKKLARVDVPLNDPIVKDKTQIGLRLLFMNELDMRGGNPITTAHTNSLSLAFEGVNGIYEKYWKKTIDSKLNRSRECSAIINWPLKILSNFNWKRKYKIHDTKYLIKEIRLKIKPDDTIIFGETLLERV